jgi:NAD(P)-dependent dehydrogenase (short-subunit alcohol dehydrogenase family)
MSGHLTVIHCAQSPVDSNDVHSMMLLYCLSKAAVLFGVKIQADEPYMKARNLSVVSICPGWCQVRSTGRSVRQDTSQQLKQDHFGPEKQAMRRLE